MIKTISREQIKEKLDSQEPVTIIEALSPKYFDAEHLPGAINIPHDQVREKAPHMLPDKGAFIIVYCSNTACQNSHIAANTLQQMGYSNTYEYVEGKQHWQEGNLPLHASS